MRKSAMNHSQHEQLFDPRDARTASIIGAGMVGSRVALGLAKLGFTDITVWDHDSVSSHNPPMSLYGPEDFGSFKVAALAEQVHRLTGQYLSIYEQPYQGEPLSDVVICCADDMDVRRAVWKSASEGGADIVIDTRIAAELIWVFAIRPDIGKHQRFYEKYLWRTNSQVATAMCGMHGSWTVGGFASAIVEARLTDYINTGKTKRLTKMLAGSVIMIEDDDENAEETEE